MKKQYNVVSDYTSGNMLSKKQDSHQCSTIPKNSHDALEYYMKVHRNHGLLDAVSEEMAWSSWND